ncbi:hypothetical protein Sste5346_001194 [Sporothrix stenoceras]|uniref:Uncharacterized protein n=1 Tax=Sporothrix stenoceras TaxID=5173 RepID=A0ABR3ZQQ8_9PEZI
MPPALYDAVDIANALRNEALPALQALEEHPSLRDRDLRRFEQDDPPPYESSTDTDEDDLLERVLPTHQGELSSEDREMFNAPLTKQERQSMVSSLSSKYYAGNRYRLEERIQRRRVERWAGRHRDPEVRRLLAPRGKGEKIWLAERRLAIISRHIVKRRWQKLGVWNPKWGIPEPDTVPVESMSRGQHLGHWAWDHCDEPESYPDQSAPDYPVRRAIELRQGLSHGEHAPVQPRSHLTASSSDSQAESFITSRPWFQLPLEQVELLQRKWRFDGRDRRKGQSIKSDIVKRWKDRGDWQDKWHDQFSGDTLVGWKWRHESPSPEPEDISDVENLAGLELTPSETDAFENIPSPPRTPPPQPYHYEIDLSVEPTNPFTKALQDGKRAQLAAAAEAAAAEAAETAKNAGADAPPAEKEAPPRATRQRRAKPQPEEPSRPVRRSVRIASLAANKPPVPAKPQPAQQTRAGKGRQPTKQATLPAKSRSKQSRGAKATKGTTGVAKQKPAPKRRR